MSLYKSFSSVSSKVTRNLNLRGIFIPITTPFNSNEEIAYDKLKLNLEKYEKIPFSGYVVGGSNGEVASLTTDERINLVKFIRDNTNPSKMIIGGSYSESTKQACHLTSEMAKVGADAVLVMPPFYFKKRITDESLIYHYTTIAESTETPIVIYNMPIVSGIDISVQLLTKLAQHPLIRGVKDSDVRKCAHTVQNTKSLSFDVMTGSAGYLLAGLFYGCSGGINGLAGILGNELCELYNFFKAGRFEEATTLQERLIKADILLMSVMGGPGLKAAMDMMGYYGGKCRKPILPPSESDRKKIRECLQHMGALREEGSERIRAWS